MANYTARTRSNYFRVKDLEAFKQFIEGFTEDDLKVEQKRTETEPNRVAVFVTNPGGLPTHVHNAPEQEDPVEVDFLAALAAHLCEGEVAIFMEAGHEVWRYCYGVASAINSAGERRVVNLNDIYAYVEADLATDGVEVTRCQY